MMQYFYGLLWLLTVHFVADFILQSDWMAQNKSKSIDALGAHVAVYTITLLFGSLPLAFILPVRDGQLVLIWVVFNGGAHFLTDFVTSRINSRLWAAKKVHWFFVGVGFDQLIHAWTLGLTMVWLLQTPHSSTLRTPAQGASFSKTSFDPCKKIGIVGEKLRQSALEGDDHLLLFRSLAEAAGEPNIVQKLVD